MRQASCSAMALGPVLGADFPPCPRFEPCLLLPPLVVSKKIYILEGCAYDEAIEVFAHVYCPVS